MKKFFKKILMLASLACMALCLGVFAACSEEPTGASREEGLLKDGYLRVSYNANGGDFGNDQDLIDSLVAPGSLTPYPGYVDPKTQSKIPVPTMDGYSVSAWYPAELDKDGNVVYEGEGENKKPVLKDTAWNFTKDKVTEDVVLFAQWIKNLKFRVYIVALGDDGTYSLVKESDGTPKVGKTYNADEGDPVLNRLYNQDESTGETLIRADNVAIRITGYTPIGFYMDETLKTKMPEDLTHPGDAQPEVAIYAKCLTGDFDIITAADGATLKLNQASKWYLVENVTIPESAEAWNALTRFNGAIYGNEFTISGIRVNSVVNAIKATESKSHSLFGQMNGQVQDLTFKDVVFKVGAGQSFGGNGKQYISFLASTFGKDGLFKNVKLENCSLEIIKLDSEYPWFVYEEQAHYWQTPQDQEQTAIIQKQTVTGSVNMIYPESV
ncbi:MAG: hypothetical protein IJY62_03870 [Clostridia bacterium]|nr:hypothetical protein [Clostridia bacterium]